MHHSTKIATCCYCGQRTVLDLAGRQRHELACASCGAPISRMKSLKAETPLDRVPRETRKPPKHDRDRRYRKPKKRKGLAARVLDIAEDVFDVFD